MGVWIETYHPPAGVTVFKSHPVWVCGLKPVFRFCVRRSCDVTPCMGVWIETAEARRQVRSRRVTPCMGVWIETLSLTPLLVKAASHPVWVCGLKPLSEIASRKLCTVTPCMGVWIET